MGTSAAGIDLDTFRLRRFVERLIDMGEMEVRDEPVPLTRLSEIIERTRKGVLFRRAGPKKLELAAKVAGGRARIAAAFDTTLDKLHDVYAQRLATPQGTVQIPSGEAPVHEIVRTGDEVDLTKLPFHPQHEFDGSCYISAGIDYTVACRLDAYWVRWPSGISTRNEVRR
jgi:2,5-furandicarboxylate decarboxylase 1